MNVTIKAGLILASVACALGPAARAADGIKAGEWEFSSRVEMPNSPKLPEGAPLPAGTQLPQDGMGITHKQCIDPEKAVPSDPRQGCRIDHFQQKGAVINWTTSCEGPYGTVHASGIANYNGDTMQAALNTRAPNGKDGFVDTVQRITGRYLGPCTGR